MPFDPLTRYSNPLLRHLNRHNQVATLFHSAETVIRGETPGGDGERAQSVSPTGPVIQAKLAQFTPEVPWGRMVDNDYNLPELPYQPVVAAEPVTSLPSLGRSMPLSAEGKPALPRVTPQVEPQPVHEKLMPKGEDQAWSRLQAVYQSQQDEVQHETRRSAQEPFKPT
jgi:hypothetical protein